MSHSYRQIRVEQAGDVFIVRIHRPKLDEQSIQQLGQELNHLVTQPDCHKVVVNMGPAPLECRYSMFLAILLTARRHLLEKGGALRLCQVAEAVRAVFAGGQTIGRLGQNRAVALVSRTGDLGMSVATLTEYLDDLGLGAEDVRVWIEGLPASAESASRLLDELAR